MDLIKEIIIKEPPTKWTLVYKNPKFDKEGKLIQKQDFYLTGNLFYSDRTSYHITSNIIQDCKLFLKEHMRGIPELEKMRLEMVYIHTKDIDLDNKASFWMKLFLDILKKPTQKQIDNAKKRNKVIVTTNTIYDDTTKYIDEISMKFHKGEHCLIFRIYGRPQSNQETLNLI